jgi:hypothetical protein
VFVTEKAICEAFTIQFEAFGFGALAKHDAFKVLWLEEELNCFLVFFELVLLSNCLLAFASVTGLFGFLCILFLAAVWIFILPFQGKLV